MLPDSMNFIQNSRAYIFRKFGVQHFSPAILILFCSTFLFSCTSSKEVTYFNDLTDSQLVKLPTMNRPEPVIMPDDILAIKFSGDYKPTEALFNSYGMSYSQTSSGGEYQVGTDGNIEIYQIGAISAAGLTVAELKQKITDSIKPYLKSPVVSIRFSNFRFTVLGEVRGPGTFLVPNQHVSILEALGQAGDMTQYASRNSVRVIRDSSGKREIGMVDFNQKTVFTSPYYFLQRNDVVYVSPQKSKTDYESVTRIASILGTVMGILAVTLTILNLK